MSAVMKCQGPVAAPSKPAGLAEFTWAVANAPNGPAKSSTSIEKENSPVSCIAKGDIPLGKARGASDPVEQGMVGPICGPYP
jgi:hypothetical protein